MKTVKELRQAISTATSELGALVGDPAAFDAHEAEIVKLEGELTRTVAAQQRAAALGRPAGGDVLGGPALDIDDGEQSGWNSRAAGVMDEVSIARKFESYVRSFRKSGDFSFAPDKHFRTFGEQLQAIANYSLSRGANVDNRLVRAPTGASEVDPTGGGFLVQTDFMQGIFVLAHDMGEILGRVNNLPISSKSNSLTVNAVDETSRATGSRWGGVQGYWVAEGTAVNPTKPKFRQVKFNLHKLMAVMYMTDELLEDSSALGALASTAFSEEVMFLTEDAVFEGTGAGVPLGFMNSAARITVPKVSGQATGTILKANLDQMWSQLWSRSKKNSVWTINQEIFPQLSALNQPVSTAGGAPVFVPPGGLSGTPYGSLYGRPILETEYNSALSTEGDIALCDFSQYTLADKGGLQAATSMHVAFLTDEMVFRVTYRVDGQPMWSKPLTRFKGTTQVSPFITLQTR